MTGKIHLQSDDHIKARSSRTTQHRPPGRFVSSLMVVLFLAGFQVALYASGDNGKVQSPPGEEELGFTEKPGAQIPLDSEFVTETGAHVHLADAIKGPTILSIVYYKCPNACDFLLTGIASLLRSYSDNAAAPNLLTMTIDERETPADATDAKRVAFEAIEKPYPEDKWHFLTGSAESIKKVTDAVGFHFIRRGDDFDHPIGLIILSGKGKVTRYILGTDFLPVDLTMSLMEASTGTIQPTIARIARLCFSYDPKSHSYVFNMLQVSAAVIATIVAIFVLYLVLSGRKRRTRGGS
jgi:protein SCO1